MNDLMKLLDTETKEELSEAFNDGTFKFIGDRGFVAWLEFVRDGRLWIYINSLYLLPEHRNHKTMKEVYIELRKFFRGKYPDAIFYWEKGNDKFTYR